MLCFGDVNLLFDQARKRFERLLLQVNRSRFDYQTEMLSASLLFLYMPIFVDLLLICVVLFDVIDVSTKDEIAYTKDDINMADNSTVP